MDGAEHWDEVHATKDAAAVSWFQPTPDTSVRLVSAAAPAGSHVVDVGAGRSTLVDLLVGAGYRVTVLDVSAEAVAAVRARLGERTGVDYVVTDLLEWSPSPVDVWHDRAVFHFLTDPADQRGYVELAASAVTTGGAVVLATFAPDGPEQCSGLPTARHDAGSLATMFAPRFELEHTEREEHVTPWGAVQPFTWVVLRRQDLSG